MKIAIASGKGGTGKTTLSVNLASLLAEKEETALTDLDVEEPNSGLFLEGDLIEHRISSKMIPQWDREACTLCGNCQKVCQFNAVIKMGDRVMVFPELCHSCYACTELCPAGALPMVPRPMGELNHRRKGRLSFIEGQLNIGEEQAVPLIAQTLEYTDQACPDTPWKLYDAPPGTSCPMIEAVKDADYLILITEPTPFGLHDFRLAVETARKLGKAFGAVINREGIGNGELEAYCRREEIPVIARLPQSRRAAELYSRRELLYPELPEFRQALEGAAETLRAEARKAEAGKKEGGRG